MPSRVSQSTVALACDARSSVTAKASTAPGPSSTVASAIDTAGGGPAGATSAGSDTVPVALASASPAPEAFESVRTIVSAPSASSSASTATRTVFDVSPGANTSVPEPAG